MIKLQFSIEEVETLLNIISDAELCYEVRNAPPLSEWESAVQMKLAKALASYLGDPEITDKLNAIHKS